MPLPLRNHQSHPRMNRLKPPHQLPDRIQQQLIRAAADKELLHHAIQSRPPPFLRRQRLIVPVPHLPAEERLAPHAPRVIRHDVFLRVVRAARPIAAEARPGRQQDGRAEFCAGAELQRLDFGVRVQQVREDADGQVRACGVAAYDDVFGAVAQGGEDVAEERDGLLELVRVGGVRGEGVGEHEGGDGGGDQGGDEGDVAGVYGEVVAAAMEPEYHFLGGWITEPVCFGPVWEGLIFGSEAVLLGKFWICFIEVGANVLLMSNRRVFREGPQHSKLDMVAVFRGSRFPSEQRCEDGDQANAQSAKNTEGQRQSFEQGELGFYDGHVRDIYRQEASVQVIQRNEELPESALNTTQEKEI